MDKTLKLKPATAKDEGFLKRVYAQSRDREMQLMGWPPAQQQAFLESQYTLRSMSYAVEYPNAEQKIINYKARQIGSLLYQIGDSQIDLIDVAILTAKRGKGIGSQIVSHLCESAQTLGIKVKLFVQIDNSDAKRFYEKLGFSRTAISGTHYEMTWTPSK